MPKQRMTSFDRRYAILDILRTTTIVSCEKLAVKFDVSINTIYRDVACLTIYHPIEVVRGRYGGIRLMKNSS